MNFFRKYYYGDIPEEKGAKDNTKQHDKTNEWPLWEVFIRSKAGLDHKHAGSLHAADAEMAIENARDVYTRRMEGISIWVVEASTSTHQSHQKPHLCTNLQTIRSIVILRFMICRMS